MCALWTSNLLAMLLKRALFKSFIILEKVVTDQVEQTRCDVRNSRLTLSDNAQPSGTGQTTVYGGYLLPFHSNNDNGTALHDSI